MRSLPNRIPLSATVVERVSRAVERPIFDRRYDNFGHAIVADAQAVVPRPSDRYISWVRGDFDQPQPR